MQDYRTGRHCVFALHVHLVFVTKYRRDVLSALAIRDLAAMFAKVCEDFDAKLSWLSATGRTITSTFSSNTRRRCRSPGSSTVSKVCPPGGCVRGARKSEGAISRACCGRRPISPPHAAGRQSRSFDSTWSNRERRRLLPGLNAGVSGAGQEDEYRNPG